MGTIDLSVYLICDTFGVMHYTVCVFCPSTVSGSVLVEALGQVLDSLCQH